MSPKKEANNLTILLNALYPSEKERYSFDLEKFIYSISKQRYPDEPITSIKADYVDDFEGMLKKSPINNNWAIFYSKNKKHSRIRFTLAHELGHYLLHREKLKSGEFKCTASSMQEWDVNNLEMTAELEANIFAAYFLMPFDDFRIQIHNKIEDFNLFQKLANRYNCSLTAVILRWIEQTDKIAILIKSNNGFIDWAWSSKKALKNKIYYSARSSPEPIEVPINALAYSDTERLTNISEKSYCWFNKPCLEINFPYKQRNIENLTFLIFDEEEQTFEDAKVEDTFDLFIKK